jgi:hypothetical protein
MVDEVAVGEIVTLASYPLGIAVGRAVLVTWSGTQLYLVHVRKRMLRHVTLDGDEIHEVHLISDRRWLIIGETSVLVVEGAQVTGRYLHDDILLQSWWANSHLCVEDLRGRRLLIQVTGGFQVDLAPRTMAEKA